uniref:NAC domain-containing protein n=1 Tax=Setaria italica TaxID=4555 RepID=K4AKJ4_SETIT
MAAEDRGFRTRDDASSIALLRSIRSGVADFSFVHRADVCAAVPEDLVANLEPVPGTDLDKGGYNAIWYLYCPKRFKNAKGDHSGHRQRSIAGGDTCWHSESSPKPVKGLDGATVCNLSYGRKEGSSRSFNRMGWCMLEYDDKHGGGGDNVLCKIYRSSSSLARAKSKPTTQRLSGCKRKATGDHAQSLPSKMSHAQMAMLESLFPAEEEQFQHNTQPLLPAKEQQFLQHNTQPLLPAEEQQFLQHNTQSLLPAEEQRFLQHNTQSLLPAEEQQFQFED